MSRRTVGGAVLVISVISVLSASASASEAYPEMIECVNSGDTVRREVYDDGRIYDISHRITRDMPSWELTEGLGDFLWLAASMKNGSLANNSEMKLPTHTGTHVDAPGHVFDHYYDAGFDVDTLDLGVLNGPALLVDVPRDKNLTAEVMKSLHIPRGVRRVLFRTLNTDRGLMYNKAFDTSYVGFMRDGARWLVDNTDIKLVGIDYLSVAAFDDLIPSHLEFLESKEIILVEGLKLDDVPTGLYTVHCLPLRGLTYNKAFDTSYVGSREMEPDGIDYLSVATFDDLITSHLELLESREIILVKGLKLDYVPLGYAPFTVYR